MRPIRFGLALLAGAVSLSLACATEAAPAADGAATLLDRYLDGLQSLRTAFTQEVVDTHGMPVESGAGTLLIARPGKFRWEYTPQPATGDAKGQWLIADGRNLWFYDRELMQVTVKPVAAALSATPVTLLSGTLAELRAAFSVENALAHDGLDWVQVTPRSAEADFQRAELGFARGELRSMLIEDKLGQHVTLRFTHSQRNVRVAADEFAFKPPPGADVIGTPEPP
jgi:outer membrane lipoprotein carrier protein